MAWRIFFTLIVFIGVVMTHGDPFGEFVSCLTDKIHYSTCTFPMNSDKPGTENQPCPGDAGYKIIDNIKPGKKGIGGYTTFSMTSPKGTTTWNGITQYDNVGFKVCTYETDSVLGTDCINTVGTKLGEEGLKKSDPVYVNKRKLDIFVSMAINCGTTPSYAAYLPEDSYAKFKCNAVIKNIEAKPPTANFYHHTWYKTCKKLDKEMAGASRFVSGRGMQPSTDKHLQPMAGQAKRFKGRSKAAVDGGKVIMSS